MMLAGSSAWNRVKLIVVATAFLIAVGLAISPVTSRAASADTECESISGRISSPATVVQLSGDLEGTRELLDQISVDVSRFPIIAFTLTVVYHDEDGDVFATEVGTLNFLTDELDIVATITGGTDDWEGASGELVLTGTTDAGTYAGPICTSDDDDDGDDEDDDDD